MKQNTSNEAIVYMAPEISIVQVSAESGFATSDIFYAPDYIEGFDF